MSCRVWLLVPCVVLAGCWGSPYKGYKEVEDGVHVKLRSLGDGENLASDSDSVHVRFRISHLGEEPGSFLSTERWYATKDLRAGALMPALRRLHEGDSMSIIAPAFLWPWAVINGGPVDPVPDTAHICAELSLLAIRSPEVMRADAERHRREDPEGFEHRMIQAYLRNSKENWTRWGTSDLYYTIAGAARDTNRIKLHETISVSWLGCRLEDGQAFDDTRDHGSAFTFRYGDPDQVMKGIEVAVSLLCEGQEGRFIVPSSLAFGAKGIPGTLDPWTPVIYSVRIESVERRQ
ncbi:MAG TPA: FKBP-type peptidyl-prolyl cis-trans isomerase [Flavobacteriales bacterium]|nr:FKBP-type peptidyl-prolyl cis-trans isomerase [Flavobacteriales bacterium]